MALIIKKEKLKKGKVKKVKAAKAHLLRLKKYKHPKKLKSNRLLKYFIFTNFGCFFIIILLITFSIIGILSYLQNLNSNLPSPDKAFPDVHVASEIYDRNGVRLYRLYGDDSNNDPLSSDEITPTIKAAFMAAEDSEFYNHFGFNPDAMTRCLINIAQSKSECGASTITQQLVKLTTKQDQPTLERKINEILLSIKVEQNYTKDQIFEMYLKVTPYGSNITGLKTAAKFYFGISDLKQLSLAQVTTLAAIINNPVNLSPTLSNDPVTAKTMLKERENYILDQLTLKLDKINAQLKKDDSKLTSDPITTDMVLNAKNEQLSYRDPIFTDIKAGHFVYYTLDQLQSNNYKNGTEPFTYSDLQNGGYKIYTSLDYDLQQTAERYANQAGNDYTYWNMNNAAILTTQPSTGQILAMAGSKDFYGHSDGCDDSGQNCKFDPQVNVLTSLVSPGSTNKAFGYYEAFAESKLFPGSFLPDIPITFGDYVPRNWDGSYYGLYQADARDMLRNSRNIPALEVISMLGVDDYLNTVRNFGYTTYTGDYGPSVILGGADIKLTEHVQAYGVFANGGDLVNLNPILKIVDKNGKVVYEAQPERKHVADPQAVYQLNMSLYRLDSLGAPISWDDRDIAGKTGTTENNRNALVMMYSPDFVTVGWGGNNNNDPLDQNYGWPAYVVMPWLKQYMSEVSGSGFFSSKTPFPRPDGVYYGGGDCDSHGLCEGITKGWLIAGREPARGDVMIRQVDGKYVTSYKMPVPSLQSFLDFYVSRRR